jgi:hypothetical protein
VSVLKLADILNKPDILLARVDCPLWGGEVLLRNITGEQRDAFDFWHQQHAREGKPPVHIRAKLVAMSLCDDEKGTPASITESDVLKLSAKDAQTLDVLFDKCCELSCMFGGARADLKNYDGQSTNSG